MNHGIPYTKLESVERMHIRNHQINVAYSVSLISTCLSVLVLTLATRLLLNHVSNNRPGQTLEHFHLQLIWNIKRDRKHLKAVSYV